MATPLFDPINYISQVPFVASHSTLKGKGIVRNVVPDQTILISNINYDLPFFQFVIHTCLIY